MKTFMANTTNSYNKQWQRVIGMMIFSGLVWATMAIKSFGTRYALVFNSVLYGPMCSQFNFVSFIISLIFLIWVSVVCDSSARLAGAPMAVLFVFIFVEIRKRLGFPAFIANLGFGHLFHYNTSGGLVNG